MDNRPLVSIITPCYNGESFVHRFFDSVLNQTYTNIELIFVNDGSRDKTEDVALSYKDKLESKGIKFIYIYQENAGQAAAVNKGLEIFTGDYLTWPDSDDWMSDDCIEKKVEYLQNNTDKGLVLGKTAMVFEDELDKIASIYERKNTALGKLFDDLVFENNVCFAPGGYMVRSKDFLCSLPSRHIYECKTGQNWQMLLPIAYKYECGYIEDIVYYYLIRRNSHSRAEVTYDQLMKKTYRHEDTLQNVISSIDMPREEKELYLKRVKIKYYKQRFNLAAKFNKKEELKKQYDNIKLESVLDKKTKIIYILGKLRVYNMAIKVIRLLRR